MMNTQMKLLSSALFSVALVSGLPAVANDTVEREDERTTDSAIPAVKSPSENRATGRDTDGMGNHRDDAIGSERNDALDNNTIERERDDHGSTGPSGSAGGNSGDAAGGAGGSAP
ncbi:MAG: hypothetical protein V7756_03185 [Halopseudomonas sp.]|uniref:hypothetical protein n=1 Tax=Halopseudomonas sp. TaxID=2901191 RepID=UPI0030032DF2